jgi:tetrapyrrole methylase family protein/MazG family protein
MPKPPENRREFADLLQVVESLRGPDGCPWDKEQTHSTLTRYAIEEAFELAEAIDGGDLTEMKEELGDLLLQVILHSEIGRQSGQFDIHDVIESINNKMIHRHPHVFGDVQVSSSDEVLTNWAQLKEREKAAKAQARGVSSDAPTSFNIPAAIPALMRSQKIGEKTEKAGFDWAGAEECWPKIKEEIQELEEELRKSPAGATDIEGEIAAELGDVFFSLVQLTRHLKLDAEQVLRKANSRFESRFHRMHELVKAYGLNWATLAGDQKELYWKRAKAP